MATAPLDRLTPADQALIAANSDGTALGSSDFLVNHATSIIAATYGDVISVLQMRIAKSANPSRHWLGKKLSPEHAKKCGQKRHPIICLTDGLQFASARDAAEHYGEKPGSVYEAVRLAWPLHGRRFVRSEVHDGN